MPREMSGRFLLNEHGDFSFWYSVIFRQQSLSFYLQKSSQFSALFCMRNDPLLEERKLRHR